MNATGVALARAGQALLGQEIKGCVGAADRGLCLALDDVVEHHVPAGACEDDRPAGADEATADQGNSLWHGQSSRLSGR